MVHFVRRILCLVIIKSYNAAIFISSGYGQAGVARTFAAAVARPAYERTICFVDRRRRDIAVALGVATQVKCNVRALICIAVIQPVFIGHVAGCAGARQLERTTVIHRIAGHDIAQAGVVVDNRKAVARFQPEIGGILSQFSQFSCGDQIVCRFFPGRLILLQIVFDRCSRGLLCISRLIRNGDGVGAVTVRFDYADVYPIRYRRGRCISVRILIQRELSKQRLDLLNTRLCAAAVQIQLEYHIFCELVVPYSLTCAVCTCGWQIAVRRFRPFKCPCNVEAGDIFRVRLR